MNFNIRAAFALIIITLFCAVFPAQLPAKPLKNLVLPRVYDLGEKINASQYLLSEKLDGVRGYWDGKELLTRSGHPLDAPEFFTKNFPPFALDGELWTKRGDFSHISSIVMSKNKALKYRWSALSYNVFEVPEASGNLSARLKKLQDYLNALKKQGKITYIKIIPQIPMKSEADIISHFHAVLAKGGEGVVLRDKEASYVSGRSSTFLKLKPYLDAECRVIGYKRNHDKSLKSLRCQNLAPYPSDWYARQKDAPSSRVGARSEYLKDGPSKEIRQIKSPLPYLNARGAGQASPTKDASAPTAKMSAKDSAPTKDSATKEGAAKDSATPSAPATKEGAAKESAASASASKKLAIFYIGSGLSRDLRQKPPKLGTIITYKFYGITRLGMPRHPVFLHVRRVQ